MANVVSDTGPLIALAQIGQFDLLHRLFFNIIIPPAVSAEIQDEVSVAALSTASWITIHSVQDTLAVQLLREELDTEWVLIDERAAARKARVLGLRVVGPLGFLLFAKRAEHMSAIKPPLDSLHEHDFRMSARLYDQVLRDADES